MDMILTYVPFENMDIQTATALANQFTASKSYLPCQYRLAILRNPNYMKLQIINTVGSLAIMLHSIASLLKVFA